MAATIMLGRDFHVFPADVAVHIPVLDTHVGKMNLIIEVRQVVLPSPFLDFRNGAIRPAVTVAIAAVALLKESLVVAFQLAVELHSEDTRLTRLQPLRSVQVGTFVAATNRP